MNIFLPNRCKTETLFFAWQSTPSPWVSLWLKMPYSSQSHWRPRHRAIDGWERRSTVGLRVRGGGMDWDGRAMGCRKQVVEAWPMAFQGNPKYTEDETWGWWLVSELWPYQEGEWLVYNSLASTHTPIVLLSLPLPPASVSMCLAHSELQYQLCSL